MKTKLKENIILYDTAVGLLLYVLCLFTCVLLLVVIVLAYRECLQE